jgi:hypothetical protein
MSSIPGDSRPIPGTDGQNAGATTHRLEGRPVSKEETARALDSSSSPAASLTVMQGLDGPDFRKSVLPAEGGPQITAGTLATTLEDKTETLSADLKTVLVLLAEIMKQQRDTSAQLRDTDFALQIDSLKESAEEALQAAKARMITGIVMGSVGALLGGTSVVGGAMSFRSISKAQQGQIDQAMVAKATSMGQTAQGVGQTGQALGPAGTSVGDYFAGLIDKESKDADIESKKDEQLVGLMRDMVTAQQDMLSAVRQTLRDMQSAEAEAGLTAAKV